MVFNKFVEIGRVVMINFGENKGKTCVVINVVDNNRVHVDGPTTGVARQIINLKRVSVTDFKVKIPLNARHKTIVKALEKEDIATKFAGSAMAKKLAKKEARSALGDFDRFKVMIARKQKSRIIKKQLAALKKA